MGPMLPFAVNATPNLSIFLSTTTTIHKFGLIKVTATITPADSSSQNFTLTANSKHHVEINR